MITAIVVAHRDGSGVRRTVAALHDQTRPPERIVVVSRGPVPDVRHAACGAEVLRTDGALSRAAALNRALAVLEASEEDHVLVVDAGAVPAPEFLERALSTMQDSDVGVVGGLRRIGDAAGWCQRTQQLERARWAGQARRAGRTPVLAGTVCLLRREALQDVRWIFGRCFDEDSATPHTRLALDLEAAGWELSSPAGCWAAVDAAPTVPALFEQRRRWYLGALQDVTAYGLAPISTPWWRQQLAPVLWALLLGTCLVLAVVAAASDAGPAAGLLWGGIAAALVAGRVLSARAAGPRALVGAALVLPELAHAAVLLAALVAAAREHTARRNGPVELAPVAAASAARS